MKQAFLDLSKGLNLTSSDLSVPFKVARLPFIPKPGLNWESHPGHDAIPTPDVLTGVDRLAYSDASGILVFEKDGLAWVANPSMGLYKSGFFGAKGGAFITGLGLYRKHNGEYIFANEPAPPVVLNQPTVTSGSLSSGTYVIWALSFSKTPSGLFLNWFSSTELQLQNNSGVTITLSEAPGNDRVVNLYVQRDGASLTFLKSLTDGEATFEYKSHLQEGEVVSLAVPRGTGGLGAYYNGRHFYMASSLVVLGAKRKDDQAPQSDWQNRYGYVSPNMAVGFGGVAANTPPQTFAHTIEWKAVVRTARGVFAAVVDGNKVRILYSDDPDLLGWSLAVEYSNIGAPQCAVANSDKVVFIGNGYFITGKISEPFSRASWIMGGTPPSATDTPSIVWTGIFFAASVSGPNPGVLLSFDGRIWSFKPAGSIADGYTFHDIIDAGAYLIIQGRTQTSNGFNIAYFSYRPANGQWWMTTREERVWDGGTKIISATRRRYTAMFTIKHGGSTYVVISYGVKGGTYYGAQGQVTIPESDYHAVYTLEGFLVNENPIAWQYSPPIASGNISYQRLWLLPDYATVYFKHDGNTYRYVFNPLMAVSGAYSNGNAWGRISEQLNDGSAGAVNSERGLANIGADGRVSIVAWSQNGLSAVADYNILPDGVAPYTDGATIARASTQAMYITDGTFRTRRYLLPRASSLQPRIVAAQSYFILADGVQIGGQIDSKLYLIPRNNPSAVTQIDSQIGNDMFIPIGIVGGRVYAYYAGQYRSYPIQGGNTITHNLTTDYPSVATDGTDTFVSWQDRIYKVSGSNLSSVYTASGAITSLFSGTGKIYFSVGTGVYELNTSDFTATLKFTIPAGDYATNGAEVGGNIVVVGANYDTTGNGTLHTGIYLFSNNSLSTIHSATGRYLVPSLSVSVLEDDTSLIEFQPNTVVWTYPGYVNLTSPYYWHTFTSRTSRTINEIVPSPSGVLVFMDNETFVMSGRFTSANDTRITPFPAQVGVDAGTRISQAGSTLFIIWGGRVYAFSEGPELISYPVDDGVRFVSVAYNPKDNTLYALKEDGRLLGFNLPRGVWYNEADEVQDVAQYYDGFNSIVALLKDGRLYRRFEGGQPSPLYTKPDPIIVLEAVKVDGVDIKRLRAVFIEAKLEGPANPVLTLVNESGATSNYSFTETLASSSFGLARYRAVFPPALFRALSRMEIGFSGYRFSLGDKIELRYEGVSRRA